METEVVYVGQTERDIFAVSLAVSEIMVAGRECL